MANNIDRPNRADADGMKSFVERVENLVRQKESEKGSFMKKCAVINEDIKAVLDEAKAAGLSKASMKAVIKVRELERKVEAARENLDDDDAAVFDDIREALGEFADTPLGAAAVSKTEQDPTTAAIVGAVEADISKEEQERAAAEQRAKDDADWDAAAPKAEPEALDPKAARANRTKRSSPASAPADSSAAVVF